MARPRESGDLDSRPSSEAAYLGNCPRVPFMSCRKSMQTKRLLTALIVCCWDPLTAWRPLVTFILNMRFSITLARATAEVIARVSVGEISALLRMKHADGELVKRFSAVSVCRW